MRVELRGGFFHAATRRVRGSESLPDSRAVQPLAGKGAQGPGTHRQGSGEGWTQLCTENLLPSAAAEPAWLCSSGS